MILYLLILIFSLGSYLPALKNPHWFFRTPDFIRLQIIAIQLLLLVLFFVFETEYSWFSLLLLGLLVGTLAYQIVKVFPYSSYYPRKKPDFPSNGSFSILAANVLQTNSEYDQFLQLAKKYDADLILTMESHDGWEEGLYPLKDHYPEVIALPHDNFYGMHLYSKIPLPDAEVHYLVEDDVPSIFFKYPITEDQNVFVACLHPAPPSPTENETSKERDAELMMVGKKIREIEDPVVVCGDMNDVVWSRVTRLFKKMTDMIDPRIGRGFFPTYHAGYRFMRFPLDHLFHSKSLFVDIMERTENFGSDHFGMYYEIHLKKNQTKEVAPPLNGDEKEEINGITKAVE